MPALPDPSQCEGQWRERYNARTEAPDGEAESTIMYCDGGCGYTMIIFPNGQGFTLPPTT